MTDGQLRNMLGNFFQWEQIARLLGEVTLSDKIAMAGAIVALIAAFGALGQAAAAAASNRARFFVEFSNRYSGMGAALSELAKWYRTRVRGDDHRPFVAWALDKLDGQEYALDLNVHRRLVSRYFYDVAMLFSTGLVSDRFARSLIANNGLNIFYKICDPMNCLTQPSARFEDQCAVLRRLSPKFGNGEVFDPREEMRRRLNELGLDDQSPPN